MVRLPPFTKLFLEYQDASFDIPDRTFHSMETTYRLSSFASTTDVKELIPEFFFFPEFLCNLEGSAQYRHIWTSATLKSVLVSCTLSCCNYKLNRCKHWRILNFSRCRFRLWTSSEWYPGESCHVTSMEQRRSTSFCAYSSAGTLSYNLI